MPEGQTNVTSYFASRKYRQKHSAGRIRNHQSKIGRMCNTEHQVSYKALLAPLVALETLASDSSSAPPILLSLVPALSNRLRAPA